MKPSFNRSPNISIAIFVPLSVFLVALVASLSHDPFDPSIPISYYVPLQIGFAIALIWRRKLSPAPFFLAGLGLTLSVIATVTAPLYFCS